MERALRLPYSLVAGAVAFDLIAAFVMGRVWGLSYLESLRGLLLFTGLGLMFLGGAVGGSGQIVYDWRTHYISSRGAHALARHNLRRMESHSGFLIVTIVAGLAMFLAGFALARA